MKITSSDIDIPVLYEMFFYEKSDAVNYLYKLSLCVQNEIDGIHLIILRCRSALCY